MSTVTITNAPGADVLQNTSTDQGPTGHWEPAPAQDVVAFGSPADAGEAGRLAVREHAEALRRLRDN